MGPSSLMLIQSRRCHGSQGYMLCPSETQSKVWTTRLQQQSLGRLFRFTLGEQHFHWSRFLAKWAKKMHRTGSVIPIVHTSRRECLSSTTVNMLVKLVWELPWGGVSKWWVRLFLWSVGKCKWSRDGSKMFWVSKRSWTKYGIPEMMSFVPAWSRCLVTATWATFFHVLSRSRFAGRGLQLNPLSLCCLIHVQSKLGGFLRSLKIGLNQIIQTYTVIQTSTNLDRHPNLDRSRTEIYGFGDPHFRKPPLYSYYIATIPLFDGTFTYRSQQTSPYSCWSNPHQLPIVG